MPFLWIAYRCLFAGCHRLGTVHGGCGAVDTLHAIVTQLRQAWPRVTIVVHGDNGMAGSDMYEYCEREGLLYAFGV